MDTNGKPLIFVTVGTDHHPFDRLIEWVDGWLANGGQSKARVVVQRGASSRPVRAEGKDFLGAEEMADLMRRANALVCHGGPGTIMEGRGAGLVPIVVPRRRILGEVVDDHQLRFAARLSELGEARLAGSRDQLFGFLDRVVEDPEAFRSNSLPETRGAVTRVATLVDQVVRPRDPVPVLYVGGVGRSGTTLLDRMVGQVPGFCAVGELDNVWLRGLRDNDLCGCGKPFRGCEFWPAVGEVAFGGWDNVDPVRMLQLKARVARHRFAPFLLAPRANPAFRRELDEFSEVLGRLYAAIREVSGAQTIVDSSKYASYALALRQVPALDLRLIHMVRDSHGVVFSWTKRVLRPEVVGHAEYMPTYSPMRMSARWVGYNMMFEGLGRLGVPSMLIRYEDLVRRPGPELRRALAFAGADPRDLDLSFVRGSTIELAPTHGVAGNPMRFKTGEVPLRLDEEWRRGMDPRLRRRVSALTRPMLARYGYRSAP